MTAIVSMVSAQDFRQFDDDNPLSTTTNNKDFGRSDSIQSQHKEIPKGLKVWTIDERFGDRTFATPDTLSHMFMNTIRSKKTVNTIIPVLYRRSLLTAFSPKAPSISG